MPPELCIQKWERSTRDCWTLGDFSSVIILLYVHKQTNKHQQVWSVLGLVVFVVFLTPKLPFNSIWTRTVDGQWLELESETSTNEICQVRLWTIQMAYLLSREFAALSFKKERNHVDLIWHLFTKRNYTNNLKNIKNDLTRVLGFFFNYGSVFVNRFIASWWLNASQCCSSSYWPESVRNQLAKLLSVKYKLQM